MSFADLGDQRCRPAGLPGGAASDYGPLEAIAPQKMNLRKIITQEPDMTGGAGSLVTNQVHAYDLLRMRGLPSSRSRVLLVRVDQWLAARERDLLVRGRTARYDN